jgi:hypothetical protein
VSDLTVDPHRVGFDPDCDIPGDDWILLGVDLDERGSAWLRIALRATVRPHVVCDVLVSPTSQFPDAAFIAEHQPMVMALAGPDEWSLLGSGKRDAFVQHLVAGDVELGGNFGRFRRNLEWLLQAAGREQFGAKLVECVGDAVQAV